MKKKRCLLLAILCLLCLTGCKNSIRESTKIRVTNMDYRMAGEEYNRSLHEYYPEVTVDSVVEYAYDDENFFERADNNMVGNLFSTCYTEVEKLAEKGYIADLTPYCEKYNVDIYLDTQLKKIATYNDKIYAIPYETYVQNLLINKDIFTKAGLVDDSGNIMYPKTYNELIEYARIISEKTDAAGFAIPTCGGDGGWHLTNIAWSFGTEFEKQNASGEWIAQFNSEEFIDTLNYIYDLRWKYDVMPDNVYLDRDALIKLFGNNQVGMVFCPVTDASLTEYYGFNIDNMMFVSMPKGPYGRYSQMGGNVYMVTSSSSEKEIEACFMLMEYMGKLPGVTDDYIYRLEKELEEKKQNKHIISTNIFFKNYLKRYETDNPKADISDTIDELHKKYVLTNELSCDDAFKYDNVIIKKEEPVACQDLYKILDECILAVLTDENADTRLLAETSSQKFQKLYLDPINIKLD